MPTSSCMSLIVSEVFLSGRTSRVHINYLQDVALCPILRIKTGILSLSRPRCLIGVTEGIRQILSDKKLELPFPEPLADPWRMISGVNDPNTQQLIRNSESSSGFRSLGRLPSSERWSCSRLMCEALQLEGSFHGNQRCCPPSTFSVIVVARVVGHVASIRSSTTFSNRSSVMVMETPSRRIHPLDVAETNEAIEVRMNVPGIKAENINIELNGNLLTICGRSEEEKEEKGKTYHRTEKRVGEFLRSVTLPCSVKEEEVKASCNNGVLAITMPKAADAKSRKRIKVACGS